MTDGAAATGHPQVSRAAITLLEKGGNAFDAILGAAFVSLVAEPYFCSLGGGGFLLGHSAEENREFLYDFFVDTPGKGVEIKRAPQLEEKRLRFSATEQVFHVGMASIATPGALKGFLQFYQEHCSMDLDSLIQPALECLETGVELTKKQVYIFSVVNPILQITEYGREIFNLNKNKRLYNPLLQEFLKSCSPDQWMDCMYGNGASTYLKEVQEGGGLLSEKDLCEYQVQVRNPLSVSYQGYEVITNPPPSFGGEVLINALSELKKESVRGKTSLEKMQRRARILQKLHLFKGAGGTTHLNVIDKENNAASLSLSTGTSCGYFIPETGILMNNMMGEEDLHPNNFFSSPAGQRVPSMMSPSFIKKEDRILLSLGSGGSNRIRSAILQVLLDVIEEEKGIQEAIEAPRMHFDEFGKLQVEHGFDENMLREVFKEFPSYNVWKEKDMYFGGVHAVTGDCFGWGDSRRDGCFEKEGSIGII